MRILIVEDKVELAGLLRRALRGEGLAVDVAVRGEDALWMAAATDYDVVVLDVMLPGIDGVETCRRLRAAEMWSPILMLTARDGLTDRVRGLDGGADDYMLKPFHLAELTARLRALGRREPGRRPSVLDVGGLRLDPASRTVWRDETEIDLPPKSFALLEVLMRHPGKVLSRFQLLEAIWDDGYENRSNVVDQHVRALRERVDRPFGAETIETVRGAGYRFSCAADPSGGRANRATAIAVKLVPIRRRLMVAFAIVMALVLVTCGLFLHQRMKANLNRALDAALRSRATDLAALAQQSDSGLADARLPPGATALGPAQLISSSGRVVDRSPGAPPIPLLTAGALRRARAATPLIVDQRSPVESATRLLAQSVHAQGQCMVVAVGSSLEPVDTALGSLDSQLLLGGPVVLVFASLATSALAGAALRPVEAMRRRAAAFSGNDLGQRLPDLAADDELGRLARSLNAMLKRVEQAVHQERSFIANASHELRSPLTALQAGLELIARVRPRGNALDRQVASAIEETDRLNDITSALLLLAHADSRELVLRRRPVDVATLLAEATARAHGDGPTVCIKSVPELTIDADRELLTQAMSNLISNAHRHAQRNHHRSNSGRRRA